MSTKQLNQLATEEANRKIGTSTLIKNDQKGFGPESSITRQDNGDILRWTRIGGAMTREGERYARALPKSSKVYEMQAESNWSNDLKPPQPRNRKEFAGSGNIISWM